MTEEKKKSPVKAPAKKAEHPTFAVMVAAAITNLKEKKGSSRQAISKYICANYRVGPKFEGPLKMAIKKGVESGKLVQTKGVGVTGSFKMAKVEPEKKPAKKPVAKKAALKKPTVKKVVKAAPKSPKKKMANKTPTKKPASKKAPAKKVAAPKSPAKKVTKKFTTSPKKPVKKAAPKSPAKKAPPKSPAKKPSKVTKKAPAKKTAKKTAKK